MFERILGLVYVLCGIVLWVSVLSIMYMSDDVTRGFKLILFLMTVAISEIVHWAYDNRIRQ